MKKTSITGKIKYTLLMLVFACLFIISSSYAQDENNNHMSDSTSMHRQHMIHSESPMVMPFDMNKVTHYFIKDVNGGILIIKTKDMKDTTQAALVQSHLKKECTIFSNADFRDPKTLHGMNMPGLDILSGAKGKFKVEYKKLTDGAQLTFVSTQSEVINAIHQWFDAQLRDHGSDAKSNLD